MHVRTLKQFGLLLSSNLKFDLVLTGFSCNSQAVIPGNLFFALGGAKTDGHAHLEEAAQKGAVAAVVRADYNGPAFGMYLVKVKDPLEALQQAGSLLAAASQAKVVAITGSVGKTTTKEFTAQLLKQKYKVFATPGNNNSQIGIPLALLNGLEGDEEVMVVEMGMTEKGNIKRLTEILPPDVAILTAVELVHAANFDSLSEIAEAKSEIFSHPRTKIGFLNHELKDFEKISKVGACPKLSFSVVSSCADYYLDDQSEQLKIEEKESDPVELGSFLLLGRHNRKNLLSSIACARFFGVEWEAIRAALPNLELPERRLEVVQRKGVIFINDSYNASPVSLKAALDTLPRPRGSGKRIAVVGEMLELGKFSRQCHREVAEAALEKVDRMLCLGNECREMCDCWVSAGRDAELFSSRADLVAKLREIVSEDDVVLLKGSRANLLWKVLEEL